MLAYNARVARIAMTSAGGRFYAGLEYYAGLSCAKSLWKTAEGCETPQQVTISDCRGEGQEAVAL